MAPKPLHTADMQYTGWASTECIDFASVEQNNPIGPVSDSQAFSFNSIFCVFFILDLVSLNKRYNKKTHNVPTDTIGEDIKFNL